MSNVKLGLFLKMVAKPGKEKALGDFITGALPLAVEEKTTIAWFAVQFSADTFAIFDVFEDEAGRAAHLSGPIAAALMKHAGDLLTAPPNIERHDVLAAKL